METFSTQNLYKTNKTNGASANENTKINKKSHSFRFFARFAIAPCFLLTVGLVLGSISTGLALNLHSNGNFSFSSLGKSLNLSKLFATQTAKAAIPENTLQVATPYFTDRNFFNSGIKRDYIYSVEFVNQDPTAYDCAGKGGTSSNAGAGSDPASVQLCVVQKDTTSNQYSASFVADGGVIANDNSSNLFYKIAGSDINVNIIKIDFSNFNATTATNMSNMFCSFGDNSNSSSIILSSFPSGFGSQATDMSNMFRLFASSSQATNISFPDFPSGFGSKATDMNSMFYWFESYSNTTNISLPVFPSGFGSEAINMSYMFDLFGQYATNIIETIALPDFPAGFGSKATDMSGMFREYARRTECNTVRLSTAFPAGFGSKATDMSSMFEYFAGNSKATTITIPAFPAGFGESSRTMQKMFLGFSYETKIATITIPAFPAGFGQYSTDIREMFEYFAFQSQATTISIPAFPAGFGSYATYTSGMFNDFAKESKVTTINFPAFPAGFGSKANEMDQMFDDFASNSANTKPIVIDFSQSALKNLEAYAISSMFYNFNTGSHKNILFVSNEQNLAMLTNSNATGYDPEYWDYAGEKLNYTVKFNSNGGTGSMQNQTYGYWESGALNENKFTHQGANHYFECWSLDKNSKPSNCLLDGHWTNKEEFDPWGLGNNNYEVTLYAIWGEHKPVAPVVHKIHFNANGGSGVMTSQEFTDQHHLFLDKNTFTNSSAKSHFNCWSLDPKKEDCSGSGYWRDQDEYIVVDKKDHILYAIWKTTKPGDQKQVIFDPSGGTMKEGSSSELIIKDGYAIKPQDPVNPGFAFGGWFTTKTPKETDKPFDFKKTKITDNLVIHALWVDVKQITPTKSNYKNNIYIKVKSTITLNINAYSKFNENNGKYEFSAKTSNSNKKSLKSVSIPKKVKTNTNIKVKIIAGKIAGTSNVKLTIGLKSYSYKVFVVKSGSANIKALTIKGVKTKGKTQNILTIKNKKPVFLDLKITKNKALNVVPVWKVIDSKSKKIVSIDSSGKLVPLKKGIAKASVKVNNKTYKFKVKY